MIKADLHVHSRYSEHPSEWFLQRLGTRESYTEIETIYRTAIERGMRFVTITDHNRIEGSVLLKEKYPLTAFTGVESTTYFPEDGCKIHILVYGLTEKQFQDIETLRNNIYDFRDYLKEQGLAHSVAHATFSINKKLSVDHLCKLLLLFDYFEAANGARTKRANSDFHHLLRNLTPDRVSLLRERYAIEPFSDTPWIKGVTGGSDDHSGLQIARTFTSVGYAETPEDFLVRVMNRESYARGSHNDFKRFAFSIYKIAFDFSKDKSTGLPPSILATLNNMIFEGHSLGLKNRIAVTRVRLKGANGGKNTFQHKLSELAEEIERLKNEPVDTKLGIVYDKLATLSDELLKSLLASAAEGFAGADLLRLFKSASGIFPVAFMSLPFLSSLNLLNASRRLQDSLEHNLGIVKNRSSRRILWFTDTIFDLNGPSETIQKCAWLSFFQDLDLIPVTSLLPHEKNGFLPPNILDLPPIWSYTPEFFSMFTFRIPSLLSSIKLISEEEPDEIIISTPGPIGLLGLLCARLFHIPCTGIYHTDFTEQASYLAGDDTVCRMLEEYVRWFYLQCDAIKVPTGEYIRILSERGYPGTRMSVFPRGIEPDLFAPQENAREQMERRFSIPKGSINLLYVGRISAEKQVDKIMRIYTRLILQHKNINLIFVGAGPDPFFAEFRRKADNLPGVFFLGRLSREQLPVLYSGSDLMLFPSTTDTFGMVVLEAQACGLPVLVSDIGGPKEIIIDGVTGYELPSKEDEPWVGITASLITRINTYPEQHFEMKQAAREHVLSTYNWQQVLNNIFGLDTEEGDGSKPQNNPQEPAVPSGNRKPPKEYFIAT